MPLSINDPQAEALVRELAVKNGETEEQAVVRSLKERLLRVSAGDDPGRLADVLSKLARNYAAQPVLDPRDPEEILGYDDNGLPR